MDARSAVEAFLDALPAAHAASRIVETCTGNALQFAQLLLQDCGGKVMLFQVRMAWGAEA